MTPKTEPTLTTAPRAFECKATAEGVIEGLAATFGGEPDAVGDVIAPGAFAASLAAHKAKGSQPPMLWAHDPARIVGHWSELRETAEGLAVKGLLNLATAAGRDAFEHARAGDVTALSIGYRAKRATRRGAARLLTEIELGEISLVALPANSRARITAVKSAEPRTLASRAELRDLLRDAGLSRAAAEKVASAGWAALATPDPEPDEAEAKAALAAMIRATAAALATKGR